MKRILVILSLSAACAAPPMGLGTGARIPAAPGRNVIEGRIASSVTKVSVRRW